MSNNNSMEDCQIIITNETPSSVTSTALKRTPSETTVNVSDPPVQWERSQSDANLSLLKREVGAAVSLLGACIDEEVVIAGNTVTCPSKAKGLVSEQALVYWNLHEAVEGEQDKDHLATDLTSLHLTSDAPKVDESSIVLSDIESTSYINVNDMQCATVSSNSTAKEEPAFGALDHHHHISSNTVMEPYIDATRSMPNDINLSGLLINNDASNQLGSLNLSAGIEEHDMLDQTYNTYVGTSMQRHSLGVMPDTVAIHNFYQPHASPSMGVPETVCLDSSTVLANSPPINPMVAMVTPTTMQGGPGPCLTTFVSQTKALMLDQNFLLEFAADPLREYPSEVCDRTLQHLECCVRDLDNAWKIPFTGRDLASTMCSLARDEGVLRILAHLSVTLLRILATDESPECINNLDTLLDWRLLQLLRRAVHMLSQILTEENCNELLHMKYVPHKMVLDFLQQHIPRDKASTGSGGGRGGIVTITDLSHTEMGLMSHIIQCSWIVRHNVDWSRDFVAILQGLLKHSAESCDLVVYHYGLHTLTFACRSHDVLILRQVALALTNLSLFARGGQVLQAMSNAGVAHWLFPLAMQEDSIVQYYACLCIAILYTISTTPHACLLVSQAALNQSRSEQHATNEEQSQGWCGTGTMAIAQTLAQAVQQSGTLHLVWPFIRRHNPRDFTQSDPFHLQGRSKSWLLRLLPVLACDQEEVQALAVFHFAMEARIKVSQRRASLFQEIGAIPILHSIALSAHYLAAAFAAEALVCLGETVPHRLNPEVAKWNEGEISAWLKRIGFDEVISKFIECRLDGDLLLRLDENALEKDIGITNGLLRKRFLRELVRLKCGCSYASVDCTGLSHWLRVHLGNEYVQYTYSLISAGIDRISLPLLLASPEAVLDKDCGIHNGVHRSRVLTILRACAQSSSTSSQSLLSRGGAGGKEKEILNSIVDISGTSLAESDGLDIFIAYRRSTGSPLASLLKVHFQLRGYCVFLDIERLSAGHYPSSLMQSIKKARNFLLVLTPGTLDNCLGDEACRDWIHREIVCALQTNRTVIPVLDRFEWPAADKLPSDMKTLVTYNAVHWVHEYQDACIDKIEKFLRRREAVDVGRFTK